MSKFKKTISLRLDDDLFIHLSKIAQILGMSQSDAIRYLIQECDLKTLRQEFKYHHVSPKQEVPSQPHTHISTQPDSKSPQSDILYNDEKLDKLKRLIYKSRQNIVSRNVSDIDYADQSE